MKLLAMLLPIAFCMGPRYTTHTRQVDLVDDTTTVTVRLVYDDNTSTNPNSLVYVTIIVDDENCFPPRHMNFPMKGETQGGHKGEIKTNNNWLEECNQYQLRICWDECDLEDLCSNDCEFTCWIERDPVQDMDLEMTITDDNMSDS